MQVIFDADTFWLSQQRMAELFGVTQQDISYHLQQINDSGEIHLSDGYKKYWYGSEKWSDEAMYNLDVVIAVGYRVNSYEATQQAIAALFDKNKSTISRHIANIYSEGELQPKRLLQNLQLS